MSSTNTIFLETEPTRNSEQLKRKICGFFGISKPGGCLDPPYQDEPPYVPSGGQHVLLKSQSKKRPKYPRINSAQFFSGSKYKYPFGGPTHHDPNISRNTKTIPKMLDNSNDLKNSPKHKHHSVSKDNNISRKNAPNHTKTLTVPIQQKTIPLAPFPETNKIPANHNEQSSSNQGNISDSFNGYRPIISETLVYKEEQKGDFEIAESRRHNRVESKDQKYIPNATNIEPIYSYKNHENDNLILPLIVQAPKESEKILRHPNQVRTMPRSLHIDDDLKLSHKNNTIQLPLSQNSNSIQEIIQDATINQLKEKSPNKYIGTPSLNMDGDLNVSNKNNTVQLPFSQNSNDIHETIQDATFNQLKEKHVNKYIAKPSLDIDGDLKLSDKNNTVELLLSQNSNSTHETIQDATLNQLKEKHPNKYIATPSLDIHGDLNVSDKNNTVQLPFSQISNDIHETIQDATLNQLEEKHINKYIATPYLDIDGDLKLSDKNNTVQLPLSQNSNSTHETIQDATLNQLKEKHPNKYIATPSLDIDGDLNISDKNNTVQLPLSQNSNSAQETIRHVTLNQLEEKHPEKYIGKPSCDRKSLDIDGGFNLSDQKNTVQITLSHSPISTQETIQNSTLNQKELHPNINIEIKDQFIFSPGVTEGYITREMPSTMSLVAHSLPEVQQNLKTNIKEHIKGDNIGPEFKNSQNVTDPTKIKNLKKYPATINNKKNGEIKKDANLELDVKQSASSFDNVQNTNFLNEYKTLSNPSIINYINSKTHINKLPQSKRNDNTSEQDDLFFNIASKNNSSQDTEFFQFRTAFENSPVATVTQYEPTEQKEENNNALRHGNYSSNEENNITRATDGDNEISIIDSYQNTLTTENSEPMNPSIKYDILNSSKETLKHGHHNLNEEINVIQAIHENNENSYEHKLNIKDAEALNTLGKFKSGDGPLASSNMDNSDIKQQRVLNSTMIQMEDESIHKISLEESYKEDKNETSPSTLIHDYQINQEKSMSPVIKSSQPIAEDTTSLQKNNALQSKESNVLVDSDVTNSMFVLTSKTSLQHDIYSYDTMKPDQENLSSMEDNSHLLRKSDLIEQVQSTQEETKNVESNGITVPTAKMNSKDQLNALPPMSNDNIDTNEFLDITSYNKPISKDSFLSDFNNAYNHEGSNVIPIHDNIFKNNDSEDTKKIRNFRIVDNDINVKTSKDSNFSKHTTDYGNRTQASPLSKQAPESRDNSELKIKYTSNVNVPAPPVVPTHFKVNAIRSNSDEGSYLNIDLKVFYDEGEKDPVKTYSTESKMSTSQNVQDPKNNKVYASNRSGINNTKKPLQILNNVSPNEIKYKYEFPVVSEANEDTMSGIHAPRGNLFQGSLKNTKTTPTRVRTSTDWTANSSPGPPVLIDAISEYRTMSKLVVPGSSLLQMINTKQLVAKDVLMKKLYLSSAEGHENENGRETNAYVLQAIHDEQIAIRKSLREIQEAVNKLLLQNKNTFNKTDNGRYIKNSCAYCCVCHRQNKI